MSESKIECRTHTRTQRYIYRCSRKGCKGVKSRDMVVHTETTVYWDIMPVRKQHYTTYDGERSIPGLPCPVCGTTMYGTVIKGYKTEQPCSAKCTNAIGPTCECSCGGANHGQAHL